MPVVVDHEMGRQIGVVRELSLLDWPGGRWGAAHVTLNDCPAWLKRGTPAGFGRFNVYAVPLGEDAERVVDAFIQEVSVLRARRPAEPGARVEWLGVSSSPPAVPTASDRTAGGEVELPAGRIIRPGIGQVLAVGGKPLEIDVGRGVVRPVDRRRLRRVPSSVRTVAEQHGKAAA